MSSPSQPAPRRSRSPGYPSFSLPEAIRKAQQIYKKDKRNPVPLSVAAEHWGYSPASSAVLLSAATLKKFGLLEEVSGGGSSRLVRLTDLALNILISDEGSVEWAQAVRVAALAPPVHMDLWQQYGEDLPSDPNLKRTLVIEKKFNDAAASDLIREYKETISFAKPNLSSKMEQDHHDVLSFEPAPMSHAAPYQKQLPSPTSPDGLREYRFPLTRGVDFRLWLPTPLTEDDYELVNEQLEFFMRMAKRTLVAPETNQGAVGRSGPDSDDS